MNRKKCKLLIIVILGLSAVCLIGRQQILWGNQGAEDLGTAVMRADMTQSELELAMDVLTAVNQERAAQGLSQLTWHNGAAQTAYDHSADMDDRNFFDHTNPDGQSVGDRLTADGIGYTAAGENIAMGYQTVASVMEGWMNSPGHRANILRENFTHLGVGVHLDDGGPWWTQVFLVPTGQDTTDLDVTNDDTTTDDDTGSTTTDDSRDGGDSSDGDSQKIGCFIGTLRD